LKIYGEWSRKPENIACGGFGLLDVPRIFTTIKDNDVTKKRVVEVIDQLDHTSLLAIVAPFVRRA
jgi:hypothetical protein